jgi:cell division protein FtsW (lipid II flippase)
MRNLLFCQIIFGIIELFFKVDASTFLFLILNIYVFAVIFSLWQKFLDEEKSGHQIVQVLNEQYIAPPPYSAA